MAKNHARLEASLASGQGLVDMGVTHTNAKPVQAQSELGTTTTSAGVKRYGEVDNLLEARRTTGFKFYNEFTKRFDQTHLNTQLRAPHYLRH